MYAEADGEGVPLSLSEARSSEHPNYDDYHVERGVGLLRDLKVGAKKSTVKTTRLVMYLGLVCMPQAVEMATKEISNPGYHEHYPDPDLVPPQA